MSEILEQRRDIAAQLEATRDLQGIENIPKNKKLLSETRKGLKNIPEGMQVGGVNKLFRAIRLSQHINELTAKDLPTLTSTKESPKNKTHKDLPGQKLTSDEFRTYNTTGMYKGEFKNPLVLQQVEDLEGNWPKWNTGESKSFEGFMKEMRRGWNIVAKGRANLKTKRSSTKHVRGHITDAATGGSNWPGNIVNQPEASYTKGMKIGEGGLISNETLRSTFKHPDDLRMAGFTGQSVDEAFQEYLMAGDKNKYQTSDRFTQDQRSRMAHQPGRTAESLGFQFEQEDAQRQVQEEIAKTNVKVPELGKAKTPKDVFFNVVRSGARVAGQSMNPFANIAGDLVGAAMDTAVYISNPKDAEALADMTLSGGQAIISVGSLLIAALPVPGARPGAYALVKLGDRLDQAGAALDKVEKVWNMTREGRQIAKNYRAGKNTKLEGGKSKPNIVSKQSGQEVAEVRKELQTAKRVAKNTPKLYIP